MSTDREWSKSAVVDCQHRTDRPVRSECIATLIVGHSRSGRDTATSIVRAVPPAKVDTEDSDEMKSRPIHSQLPMVGDTGFVESDHLSEAVRYADPPVLLDKFLRLCANVAAPSEQFDQP